jgi:hypothetical protein
MTDNNVDLLITTLQTLSPKKSAWPLHYYATEADLKDKTLYHAHSGTPDMTYPKIFNQFVPNEHQSKFHGKPKGRYYVAYRV